MKKLAIIGTNGLPAKYGGFETLTHFLVKNIGVDFDILVYCSKTRKKNRVNKVNYANLKYLPFKANGWQSVFYDAFSIIHAFFTRDILLVLGPTSAGAVLWLKVFFPKKRVVVNYGGAEWKRHNHSKLQQRFAKFNCIIAAKYADVNIADNKAIRDELLLDLSINSCKIIEYGGDHVRLNKGNRELVQKYPFLNEPYFICVGRAQIDNNQHMIASVFSKIPKMKLVMISNWQHNKFGLEVFSKFRDFPNIYLLDPVYNQEEIDCLRSNCKVYIHSHSQCGTAPSLVEAMNLNVPIISYDVPTNRETTENKAFYFGDTFSLKKLLDEIEILNIEQNRNDMYKIAKERYNWKSIATQYMRLMEF